ncbi:hypothetical protein ACJX0J_024091, partial [Zea mays]
MKVVDHVIIFSIEWIGEIISLYFQRNCGRYKLQNTTSSFIRSQFLWTLLMMKFGLYFLTKMLIIVGTICNHYSWFIIFGIINLSTLFCMFFILIHRKEFEW